jgi:hypothetical protein
LSLSGRRIPPGPEKAMQMVNEDRPMRWPPWALVTGIERT